MFRSRCCRPSSAVRAKLPKVLDGKLDGIISASCQGMDERQLQKHHTLSNCGPSRPRLDARTDGHCSCVTRHGRRWSAPSRSCRRCSKGAKRSSSRRCAWACLPRRLTASPSCSRACPSPPWSRIMASPQAQAEEANSQQAQAAARSGSGPA